MFNWVYVFQDTDKVSWILLSEKLVPINNFINLKGNLLKCSSDFRWIFLQFYLVEV